mmetsp:Transcript_1001/g.1422  ORF Transcript_1001/g.1422 Transcript_1001/m.1422 type:complete len:402 (-) Transcript_1001:522-1727(-)|eukprot:CAMPEP_0185733676 /NCGR_PEP_ID=MMETSP1171-20130828/20280_1 /TAXON_ID=374046 /ORGANISM="Helicotheca tamensis, Strain CCMP826" /LENGTH=401 /DNA_ID=CAMNT_0028403461 /DNA_START=47 /DNA_END=1252 /DNA_ORIENTATION=-
MRVTVVRFFIGIAVVEHVWCGSSSSSSSSSSSGATPSTQFSFEVKDSKLNELDAIDPSVTWTTSKQRGPYSLSCGVDVSVKPNTEYFSEVKTIWGKVSRSFGSGNNNNNERRGMRRGERWRRKKHSQWNVSARASVDVENYEDYPGIVLDVNAVNSEDDAAFKIVATAGNDEVSIDEIQMSKGFQALDGRLSINPRYDRTNTHVSDVILGYSDTKSDTNVQVIASLDEQSLRVSRRVGDKDSIAPTISTSGRVVLEWLHDLNDEGDAVITTVEPNESVNVQWTDGPWTANVRAPLNRRIMMDQVEVSIKRKMDLSQEDLSEMFSSSASSDPGKEEQSSVGEEEEEDVSSMFSSYLSEKMQEEGEGMTNNINNALDMEQEEVTGEAPSTPKMKYFGWYGRFF